MPLLGRSSASLLGALERLSCRSPRFASAGLEWRHRESALGRHASRAMRDLCVWLPLMYSAFHIVKMSEQLDVAQGIQKVKGVKSADTVTGGYDVLATIEAADLDALGAVVKQLHSVSGICKTTTLIVVKY